MQKATCGGCDTVWDGQTRRAHCATCHHTFASPRLFDRHRWARGRGWGCYTPQSLNMVLTDGTWYDDGTEEEGEHG